MNLNKIIDSVWSSIGCKRDVLLVKTNFRTKDIKTHELLAGRYKVEGRIATGGMGKIYRALQGEFDRQVAVKIIDMDQLTPEMQARFRREMKTLIDLDVPNVIAIYDYDHFRGYDFYVMPLLQGGTLSQRIELRVQEKRGLPSPGEVNQRVQLLAQALYRVHQKGIIHRDIKPSNIMFDDHGQPFIIDFGIAREIEPEIDITLANVAIGTWPYMCLNQINGKKPTPSFDVYALAVVIYQTLNSSYPYSSQTERNYSDYIIDLKTFDTPLQNWRGDLPESLKQVLRKALSQDISQQYPDMLAFAGDFAAATAALPAEDTGFFTFPVPQAPIDIHDLPSTMHSRQSVLPNNTTLKNTQQSIIRNRRIVPLMVGMSLIVLMSLVLVRLIPSIRTPSPVATEIDSSTTQIDVSTPPSLAALPSSTRSLDTATSIPTIIPPTFTPTTCDALVNNGLSTVEQWKDSGCPSQYDRQDPELGEMVLIPCITEEKNCKPIWVNKYEITREQSNQDTDKDLPWTNIGPSRASNWCQDRQGRLLTIAEWQYISGAALGWKYPWGMEPRTDYPPSGSPYDAKTYLADQSWAGVIGMGGNVAEWVKDERRIGSHFRSDVPFLIDEPAERLSNSTGDSTVGIRCAKNWSPQEN